MVNREELTTTPRDLNSQYNTTKKIVATPQFVSCHLKYHSEKIKESTGTTRCSVDSDLTDES